MGVKRIWLALGAAALVAVLVVGLLQAGGGESTTPAAAPPAVAAQTAKLEGAPKPLSALHAQANQLLGGGSDAFKERLAALKGYPVVVNKWASWCPPCRAEFPYFQRQAARLARKVAFIGVDSNDNDGDAREFLDEFPVP